MNDSARAAIAAIAALEIHDVSPVFHTNMPGWPTHPTMGVIPDHRTICHHGYNAQTLVMSEHTGSHVDAPVHNHEGLASIEHLPADALIGPYKKYDLAEPHLAPGDEVDVARLRELEARDGFALQAGDIAVLQWGWDRHYRPDAPDPAERDWWGRNQPGLSEAACRYIAEAGVKAVASDTVACETCLVDGEIRSNWGHSDHWLPNGILIVEGLVRLTAAPAEGLFLALPLPIRDGSGSPVRVLLYA